MNAVREIEEKKYLLAEETSQNEIEKTEPQTLEKLIVNICSLLTIGFGEAGTDIISKVIQDTSCINVMIQGQKVMAIFGFCDIRNFTDATEVLEADVMVFVNEIAEICHSIVSASGGHPNKNIGDAFLLVWKFNDADIALQK